MESPNVNQWMQQMRAAGPLIIGLTNDIHPLLRRENFTPDVDWNAILPVLRLVSRMLFTQQVLHFLYVTWFGRTEEVEGTQMRACRSDRTVTNLSRGDVSAVKELLLHLSNMVTFTLDDLDSVCCTGMTVIDHSRTCYAGYAGEAQGGLPGAHSIISIHKTLYEKVRKPFGPTVDQDFHHLTHCLNVAVTLLHEIAHAANFAVLGNRDEAFYEDAIVAEAGFEVVSRLFGANIDFEIDDKTFQIFEEWPSRGVVDTYNSEDGEDLPCRDIDRVPKHPMAWDMPPTFVAALFQDAFWDWTETAGPLALICPKIAESVKQAIRRGEHIPVPSSVADLFKQGTGSEPQPTTEHRTLRQGLTATRRQERNASGFRGWWHQVVHGRPVRRHHHQMSS